MKAKTIQFQIAEPCQQKWLDMPSLPGGRFCGQCEKTIVDFTEMSDMELVRYHQRHQGNICGVFRADQLKREMPLPQVPTPYSQLKTIGALLSGLLFFNVNTDAQPMSLRPPTHLTTSDGFQKLNTSPSILPVISGTVMDENGEPLMFANVVLKKGNQIIKGTETDEEGYFKLDWKDSTDFTLTVSYIGYQSRDILIQTKNFNFEKDLDVSLKNSIDLPEVVVTAIGTATKCDYLGGLSIIGTEEINNKSEPEIQEHQTVVKVFPNPFTHFLQVDLNLLQDETMLFHLYNSAGVLVFAETQELPKGQQIVELLLQHRNLTNGIYFLRISNEKGEMKTKEVVKIGAE